MRREAKYRVKRPRYANDGLAPAPAPAPLLRLLVSLSKKTVRSRPHRLAHEAREHVDETAGATE